MMSFSQGYAAYKAEEAASARRSANSKAATQTATSKSAVPAPVAASKATAPTPPPAPAQSSSTSAAKASTQKEAASKAIVPKRYYTFSHKDGHDIPYVTPAGAEIRPLVNLDDEMRKLDEKQQREAQFDNHSLNNAFR